MKKKFIEKQRFGLNDVVGEEYSHLIQDQINKKVELVDKYDTVKRVNRIIAEETKNIDENSSFDKVLHAVKVLRTEVGDVIKDLPTIKIK